MLTFASVFVACQGVAAAREMVEKQAEQQWDELEKLNKVLEETGAYARALRQSVRRAEE